MALQQFLDIGRVEHKAISARERELRLQAPVAPEMRPAFAPAVLLRRRTDEIVARPAEALRLLAVHGSEHAAERREVAAAAEREEFHEQECAVSRGAMREGLGRSAAGGAEGGEAVGFRGEGLCEAGIVQLEEHRPAGAQGAVAAMDAAAAHRLRASDAELAELHPEVRRVFARLSRSTRMPMKARSNLLRQETLACSRSATRTRRMRDSAPAVTVAPRWWPLNDR